MIKGSLYFSIFLLYVAVFTLYIPRCGGSGSECSTSSSGAAGDLVVEITSNSASSLTIVWSVELTKPTPAHIIIVEIGTDEVELNQKDAISPYNVDNLNRNKIYNVTLEAEDSDALQTVSLEICTADPCRQTPCQNGGTCEIINTNKFKCNCPEECGGALCELCDEDSLLQNSRSSRARRSAGIASEDFELFGLNETLENVTLPVTVDLNVTLSEDSTVTNFGQVTDYEGTATDVLFSTTDFEDGTVTDQGTLATTDVNTQTDQGLVETTEFKPTGTTPRDYATSALPGTVTDDTLETTTDFVGTVTDDGESTTAAGRTATSRATAITSDFPGTVTDQGFETTTDFQGTGSPHTATTEFVGTATGQTDITTDFAGTPSATPRVVTTDFAGTVSEQTILTTDAPITLTAQTEVTSDFPGTATDPAITTGTENTPATLIGSTTEFIGTATNPVSATSEFNTATGVVETTTGFDSTTPLPACLWLDPCVMGGVCLDIDTDTYACRCLRNTTGKNCQLEQGHCHASGDPHYTSFDGTTFDYMGGCQYVLSQECGEDPLYTVVQNNLKSEDNPSVAYTHELYIYVFGLRIDFLQEQECLVDGVITLAPAKPLPGLDIIQEEGNLILRTNFSLEVHWDGDSTVDVYIDETFKNRTCGLCGNYNGDEDDDFLNPNRTLEFTQEEFGNSWHFDVFENETCVSDETEGPHPCDGNEDRPIAVELCSIITNSTGPFGECAFTDEATTFNQSCLYDYCALGEDTHCDNIANFAVHCQEFGYVIDEWRTEDLCPFNCPAHSKYNLCANPCQATCTDPGTEYSKCPEYCNEGCECDRGYVLENGVCIPEEQCGCYSHGSYHQAGTYWDLEGCSDRCYCEGGNVTCEHIMCHENAFCGLLEGVYGCHCFPQNSTGDGLECLILPCELDDPCLNGGQCLNINEEDTACRCLDGTTGPFCDKEQGVCHASGDPHYISFDGTAFDYMGGCQYVYAQECSEDPLFTVIQNNLKAAPVAHTHELFIFVYDLRIDFLQDQEFTIDGEITLAPAQPVPEVDIVQEAGKLILRTDFGLEVHWNGENTVDVYIDASFKNRTCGLCGNFDGDGSDDYMNPDGVLESSQEEFGNSWHYEVNDTCVSDEMPGPHPCDANGADPAVAESLCSVIVDEEGPFGDCALLPIASTFNASCNYDYCALGGNAHCDKIASFAEYCQSHGYEINPWRMNNFCPFKCPAYSTYDVCANPCAATCTDPGVEYSKCTKNCNEGCECDEGYVLEGNNCIPEDQCGCYFDGSYHQHGSTFDLHGCSQRCTCSGGNVTCEDIMCDDNAYCGLLGGVYGCHCFPQNSTGNGIDCTILPCLINNTCPSYAECINVNEEETACRCSRGHRGDYCEIGQGNCHASGDPHYISFDGTFFDYMGGCNYVYSQECSDNPLYRVIQNNMKPVEKPSVALTHELYIFVFGLRIDFLQGQKLRVDGEDTLPPVQPLPGLDILIEADRLKLKTNFSLEVHWNGKSIVDVFLDDTYMENTCGLCGNFNDDPDDDYLNPNETLETTQEAFGNSWHYMLGENDTCVSDEMPGPHPCEGNDDAPIAEDLCSIITNTTGPFGDCANETVAEMYQSSCEYDFCALGDDAHCDKITSFAVFCQSSGYEIEQWRDYDFCPYKCPANSEYSLCANPCQATCQEPGVPYDKCTTLCGEGCECDEGYVMDSGRCVLPSECGCFYEGAYRPHGSTFDLPGCGQRCTCSGGNVTCEESQCHPNAYCGVLDGEYGCHCFPQNSTGDGVNCMIEPCKLNNTCTNGAECVNLNEEEIACRCSPVYVGPNCEMEQGHCHASGDPHYISFDGKAFDYMGGCQYVFSQECGEDPLYTVVQRNLKSEPNPRVAFTHELYIFVFGLRIDFLQNQEITVDDEIILAPAQPVPGLDIYQEGGKLILTTNFSLEVHWDGVNSVDVYIDASFMNRTCGLCGNFDSDDTNEYLNPDRVLEDSQEAFGNSWHYSIPEDTCVSNEMMGPHPCDVNAEREPIAQEYCGIITNSTGPFGECADLPIAEAFQKSCEYDYCALGDDAHCDKLNSFADYCQSYGIEIELWRSEDLCPLECPPHSSYKTCANPCQASCTDPGVPYSECPTYCSEGCECDEGYKLENQKCIPEDECGCYYDNKYHQNGASFIREGCMEQCTCSGGNVTCEDVMCHDNAFCGLQDGVYGCHCFPNNSTGDGFECTIRPCLIYESCNEGECLDIDEEEYVCRCLASSTGEHCEIDQGHCHASGDPHYISFDGTTFDYMGGCQYVLSQDCGNNSLYTVIQKNLKPVEKPSVAYTHELYIFVYGLRIDFLQGQEFTVDDVITLAPTQPVSGLDIVQEAGKLILRTNFSLEVHWDGDNTVDVFIDETFKNETCGLCGNFNVDASDDYLDPNGTLAGSQEEFGNSWHDENDDGCSSTETPGPHPCTENDNATVAENLCSIITNSSGPFGECADLEIAQTFQDSCKYDYCALGDGAHCDKIASFAEYCQSYGYEVEPWRTEDLCPFECPPNSNYSVCVNPWQKTCTRETVDYSICTEFCNEGCQCLEGYVMEGNQCIPEEECGCEYDGSYRQNNSSFIREGCTEQCTCLSGSVVCEDIMCDENAFCGVRDGIYGCHCYARNSTGDGFECTVYPCQPNNPCESDGVCLNINEEDYACRCPTNSTGDTCEMEQGHCHASGDPHYISFDARKFDYMGGCQYVLSQECGGDPLYRVIQNNLKSEKNPRVAYTHELFIFVFGLRIDFLQGKEFRVDDEIFLAPLHPVPGLDIFEESGNLILRTNFSLEVHWDGENTVDVLIDESFKGQTCGLCGNYNGDAEDDFMNPFGDLEDRQADFGNSWFIYLSENDTCVSNETEIPDPCHMNPDRVEAQEYCKIITTEHGPFGECSLLPQAKMYRDSCEYDYCSLLDDTHCVNIENFAAFCQDHGYKIKPWRKNDFCPFECPENSEYEICTNPCQKSCNSTGSDYDYCTEFCNEGCQCVNGTVLEGDRCIPEEDCGCFYDDRYHRTGDQFTREGCMELCLCDSGVVTCEEIQCHDNATCGLEDGIYGCHCDERYTGDGITCRPVYVTTGQMPTIAQTTVTGFGTTGDFGTLGTTQAITTDEPTKGPATIAQTTVTGEGTTGHITFGTTKSITTDIPTKVPASPVMTTVTEFATTDDVTIDIESTAAITTEFQSKGPVTIGQTTVTEFQTTETGPATSATPVTIGQTTATEFATTPGITLESTAAITTEMITKEPVTVAQTTVTGFGTTDEITFPTTPAITTEFITKEPATLGLTTVTEFGTTKEEVEFTGSPTQPTIMTTATEFVTMTTRESTTMAPLPCSNHSCVNGTCVNEEDGYSCDCYVGYTGPLCDKHVCDPDPCDNGFACLVDGNDFECDCAEGYFGRNCSIIGPCVTGDPCQNGAECLSIDGDTYSCRCLANSTGTDCETAQGHCHASGDPHYISFDGTTFDYMGGCQYVFSQECGEDPLYTVVQKNLKPVEKPSVAYTHELYIFVYGLRIDFLQEQEFTVDGEETLAPAQPIPGVDIVQEGGKLILRTNFSLEVQWNGDNTVDVFIDESFSNRTCGLCGNFNGETSDDLTTSEGGLASSQEEFGNSWHFDLPEDDTCVSDEVEGPHPCDVDNATRSAAEEACSIIANTTGPFAGCNSLPITTVYADACQYDYCALGEGAHCDKIASFAAYCQSYGHEIEGWRTEEFCPLGCPAYSTYSICSNPCQATCSSPGVEYNICPTMCSEGCQCNEGYVMESGLCIPEYQCGCPFDGRYHRDGDIFTLDDCTEQCTCNGGNVTCEAISCSRHATCGLQDGVYGCHCNIAYEGDGITCTSIYGTCTSKGHPHLSTYDGKLYDVAGTCDYVFTSDCLADNRTFEVITKNVESEWNSNYTYTDSVLIKLEGYDIELGQDYKVLVDGARTKLPVKLDGFKIYRAGQHIRMKADVGLMVHWNGRHFVKSRLLKEFEGETCGLCGNFNNDANDDLIDPEGNLASVTNFVDSWAYNAECTDLSDSVPHGCDAIDDSELDDITEPCNVFSDSTGPLAECMSILGEDLSNYYHEFCRSEACLGYPYNNSLACNAIESFVSKCNDVQVTVGNWRSESLCPLPCPNNSNYSTCGSACPESCGDLRNGSLPLSCPEDQCVEGCFCDEGFYLEGDECVPAEECGCVHEGFYYEVGDSFVTLGCIESCTCTEGGAVECEPLGCHEDAICEVQNEVRGCYCRESFEDYNGDGSLCLVPCRSNQFRCLGPEYRCINRDYICDGQPLDCAYSDQSACEDDPSLCANDKYDSSEELCCDQLNYDEFCAKPDYFKCNEGIYITDDYVCDGSPYDCLDNYDESDELCIGRCFKPELPENVNIIPFKSFYTHGEEGVFTCADDYTLVGTDQFSCNNTELVDESYGNFTLPECKRNCVIPAAPVNGYVNVTGSSFNHSESVTFGCNEGFALQPNSSVAFGTCTDGVVGGVVDPVCINVALCLDDPCNSRGTCVPDVSSFECLCEPGYEGDFCENDIDECVLETDNCAEMATCNNLNGTFECTCNEGYRGDGTVCNEIVLLPFGDEQGDSKLSNTYTLFDNVTTIDFISPTLRPPAGFPIGGNWYYSMYFLDNGLIVLTKENAVQYGYPNPFSSNFNRHKHLSMIAPFWTDVDFLGGTGDVYFQVYSSLNITTTAQQDMLDEVDDRIHAYDGEAASSNYTTNWLAVITWYNVIPFVATGTNTFQAALATDGVRAYVLFNYRIAEMTWDYDNLFLKDVIIGYNTGDGEFVNTHLDDPPFTSPELRFTPDQFTGNTGLQARWIYRVENNTDDTLNPKQECLDWHQDQPDSSEWARTLGTCPCAFTQRGSDMLAFSRRLGEELAANITAQNGSDFCLFTAASPDNNNAGMYCCYRGDLSLIEGFGDDELHSSFAERYQYKDNIAGGYLNSTLEQLWMEQDLLPRKYCCGDSNDEAFCALYEEKRPAGNCEGYLPARTGWLLGDPHFQTLDNVRYTFNGLGEYTLLTINNEKDDEYFTVQGRTERILDPDTQTLGLATKFVAFAAEIRGSTRVEMRLNDPATDFDVFIDGKLFDKSLLEIGLYELPGLSLHQSFDAEDTERIIASWSSGISISVMDVEGLLDIVVELPQSYKTGITEGLLGVWDDNPKNDLQKADGSLLVASGRHGNYTEQDFFEFGETWRIPEEDSIFMYNGQSSWHTYNDLDFQPVYLVDLEANASPSDLVEAREVCGDNKECLFDTLVTKNIKIGKSTLNKELILQDESDMLANFPPHINGVHYIEAKVGEPVTLQLNATDPNGDAVSLMLYNHIPGASLSRDGLFTWIPANTNQVSIGFNASDEHGATSVLQPVVKLCQCQNGGSCLYDKYTEDSDIVNDKFAIVVCKCPTGFSGDFCEQDTDSCFDDPCFPGVTCLDNLAPLAGYTCGSCPAGMAGDGFKCYDIDECTVYEKRDVSEGGPICEQFCINTLGTYSCNCDPGYGLHPNGRQCIDIDECELQSDTCSENAICTNTEGSYECACKSGFVDIGDDGRLCQDIDECLVDISPCDPNALCRNIIGSFICTCASGYEGDGLQCQDVDECSRNLHNCDEHATCENALGTFGCFCNSGWQGDGKTCTNINECERNDRQCPSRSVCEDYDGGFTCKCLPGFIGDGVTCIDVDECHAELDDCDDSISTCVNLPGGFVCRCHLGYHHTEGGCQDVNECAANNGGCSVNALCTNTEGSFTCQCKDGFLGDGLSCQDVDECSLLFHTCDIATEKCVNTPGSFVCPCKLGYQKDGDICKDIDECSLGTDDCEQICVNTLGRYECYCNEGFITDPSEYNLCLDIDECSLGLSDCHQECTNTSPGYQCSCYDGFEEDDGFCKAKTQCTSMTCTNGDCYVDEFGTETCMCYHGYKASRNPSLCLLIDECNDQHYPDRCQHTCYDANPGYRCYCLDGYYLNYDSRTCSDLNECSLNINDCNFNKEKCINTIGGFQCQCKPGWKFDGSECRDVNECYTPGACAHDASCDNSEGSYSCTCDQGFHGDGRASCQDIDECATGDHTCSENAACHNTIGSYTCSCLSGFTGDGFTCTDINECLSKTDCSPLADCINVPGSYRCQCQAGFVGNGKMCNDTNECLLPRSDPLADSCDSQASCSNTFGGYSCQCKPGFTGNGLQCQDVNECENSPCPARSFCTNLIGSYQCTCNDGYRGDPLIDCVDVNECVETPNICHRDAVCSNSVGSYHCQCNPGYTGDGFTCQDIDECTWGLDTCSALADCQNTKGSYVCLCKSGFLDEAGHKGRQCEDVNECQLGTDTCDEASEICINIFGSFDCLCADGYRQEADTCVDVDECVNRPCDNIVNTKCENYAGSYHCICQTGFYNYGGFCQEALSLSGWVLMTDITGVVVNGPLFEINNVDTYKTQLEQDMDSLFEASGLEDYLGTLVNSITLETQGAKVSFTLDLQKGTVVLKEDILTAFVGQLTGRDGRVIIPNSRVVHDSFNITVPIVNQCAEQTYQCGQYATCVFEGITHQYTCSCGEGYTGDGHAGCTDVNECLTKPCDVTTEYCVNTPGRYRCDCRIFDGYMRHNGVCQLYQRFEGHFRITAINDDTSAATFVSDLYDSSTPAYTDVATKVSAVVRYAYLRDRSLQAYYQSTIVLAFSRGSIIADFIVTFDLRAHTNMSIVEQILKNALAGDHLMTGAASLGNLTVDPSSIHFTEMVKPANCTQDFCLNDGTCLLEGEYPDLNTICLCRRGYSGSRCDEREGGTDTGSATRSPGSLSTLSEVDRAVPTLGSATGSLSDFSLVGIIVGSAAFLLILLILTLCTVLLIFNRRRNLAKRLPPVSQILLKDINDIYRCPRDGLNNSRGSQDSIFSTDEEDHIYGTADEEIYTEDDRRMRSLADVISRSSALNDHMSKRQGKPRPSHKQPGLQKPRISNKEFMRPYIASEEVFPDAMEEEYILMEPMSGQRRPSNFPMPQITHPGRLEAINPSFTYIDDDFDDDMSLTH